MNIPSTLKQGELGDALASMRSVFYALGGFTLAVNVLLLVPAIYMLQMYDRVLTSRNEGTLVLLTLLMLALLALEAALEFVRGRVMVRVGAALDLRLDARVFDAAFARTLAGGAGGSGQALSDLGTVRQFLSGKGLFAFFDVPWTPVYIVVVFLLSPWLGVFALAAALILLALAWINERATAPLLAEASKLGAGANQYAVSQLRNAQTIASMGMLEGLRERWFERQGRYLAVQGEAADRAAMIGAVTRFFRFALQSGILGFGAWLVLQNQLTPGGMIAASILLGRALAPVDLAIATWRGFVSARGAYARLGKLLAAHPVRGQSVTLPAPKGEVAAENLVVGAPGSRNPILKGVNFRVAPGNIIAVVGPSASGKSTLARALVGVWPPLAGAVRLDGADVNSWDKAHLGGFVGYLPQDVELFEGSVAENIARFGPLDSAGIVAAAQKAGVHELVLQLPQGYETPIGEGGAVLSGGQRQRVALARALYGNPVLVVLDEPNANLDDAGDAALMAALRAAKADNQTVFVMTHRVNLLRIADAIMVLAAGTIKGFGPADKVLKALPEPGRTARKTAEGAAEGGTE
jgi:ATP-binding cassette, subfamily C, bacterial exporter for protease/lipase